MSLMALVSICCFSMRCYATRRCRLRFDTPALTLCRHVYADTPCACCYYSFIAMIRRALRALMADYVSLRRFADAMMRMIARLRAEERAMSDGCCDDDG